MSGNKNHGLSHSREHRDQYDVRVKSNHGQRLRPTKSESVKRDSH